MQEKYKVKAFSDFTGVAEKTIYDAIKRDELKTCEEKDIETGRTIKFIIAGIDEIEKFKEIYLKRTRKEQVKNEECNKIFTGEIIENNEKQENSPVIMENLNESLLIIKKLSDTLETTQNQVTEYAFMAGQTKLLEDSENRTRLEYHKLMTENIQVKIKLTTYIVIISVLTAIVVFSLFFSFYVYSKIKEKDSRIEKLNAYNNSIIEQLNSKKKN